MNKLAAITMALLLASCSDESNENLTLPKDLHTNEREIAATAEFDAQVEERSADGWAMGTELFQTETELLIRGQQPVSALRIRATDTPTLRKAYFGDLHVHTANSFDAFTIGTLATPHDAYRYAKGEAISHPAGFDMQMSRPLDFYAVTDHAMFLGVVKAAADTTTEFSKNEIAKPLHDLNAPENMGAGLFDLIKRVRSFASFLPDTVGQITTGQLDRNQVRDVVRSAWSDTIDAADQFYDPGNFTTFAGYEYTSSTAGSGNLHRNVIFKGTGRLPREPFSRFHSVNPEDLWQWMDELREKGVESLAIPHNSNGSNGQMFKLEDWAGNPLDDDYAKLRLRNEPIVEITQIKGTSETHPVLSTRDEWAAFEIMPYRVGAVFLSKHEGSYVREALLNGLALEQEGITNPYQFGFIGSSDTHTGASEVNEQYFSSKLGLLSGTAEQRGSVPQTGVAAEVGYQAMKLIGRGRSRTRIDGGIYAAGWTPTFGASGLAAAWAEENTRESLYSAFRRKEVFATSGPRMQVRFFAGYGFDESMLTAADGIEQAYAAGVSMGGTLLSNKSTDDELAVKPSAPGFIVMALADLESAPLQRLQIVKGWVDADGTHEEVIDVACAGGANVNLETNRCPDNGAKVDISDCSINAETGSGQLSALWHDPEFRAQQRAFYYARVIENPTCRWSTWDANRAGVAPRPDLPTTIQERAWSSPIHYLPK
ncbi:MAG TPA: DUF3604 domain-containing protein [Arenicellales bacterium]|jgi:hypothetical protein|nr:DUF3604 domain-containing protein [Pseudomonadales bacterium]MDP7452929.1 DUF3604 domain-containing protein [Arenicellales bacterium]HJL53790.1 DUF3604 domain-containing protein [Arenicellales bacterium]HJP50133.1 DUF3604 domain-containing protein [Pseudomonadales bacterium]|tara:strand:- start:190 stop:2322 length:2133 start_codon:yes stop_codon:yes gene_type:complete